MVLGEWFEVDDGGSFGERELVVYFAFVEEGFTFEVIEVFDDLVGRANWFEIGRALVVLDGSLDVFNPFLADVGVFHCDHQPLFLPLDSYVKVAVAALHQPALILYCLY